MSTSIKLPMTEGGFFVSLEALRLVGAVGNRVENAEAHLKQSRVPFNPAPFRRLQDCLDEVHRELQKQIIAQLDAVDAREAAKKVRRKVAA